MIHLYFACFFSLDSYLTLHKIDYLYLALTLCFFFSINKTGISEIHRQYLYISPLRKKNGWINEITVD